MLVPGVQVLLGNARQVHGVCYYPSRLLRRRERLPKGTAARKQGSPVAALDCWEALCCVVTGEAELMLRKLVTTRVDCRS